MSNDKKIVITTRDRVLRAWQNSTELVRDFENYAKETSDDKTAAEMFQKYAVDEGRHAAELLKLLHDYQDNGTVEINTLLPDGSRVHNLFKRALKCA